MQLLDVQEVGVMRWHILVANESDVGGCGQFAGGDLTLAPTTTTINFDAIAGDKDDPESAVAKALFDAVRAPVQPFAGLQLHSWKFADEKRCMGCRVSGGSLGHTRRAFQLRIPLHPSR